MNPRQRRGLLLLVLSGLGLLAVFVLIASYVADVRTEVDPKIELLALAKPVKAYESIPDDAVTTITMPRRWAPPTALRDRSTLVGKVAGTDLTKDSLLQEGMLINPPELAPGQREVAILVDAQTGVAGKIRRELDRRHRRHLRGRLSSAAPQPQSTVVVPAARIIEVGQAKLEGGRGVQEADADPEQVVPVTFALTPKQQLRVTEAESFATEVRLALQAPERADAAEEGRAHVHPTRAAMTQHRLLLAIADAELAQSAVALMQEGEDLQVVDRVADADEAARALRRLEIDVVVLHDALGGVPVMEVARDISASFPEVGLVLIAADDSPDVLRAAMHAGLRDVVTLPLSLEQLEASVRAAAQWSRTMRERVAGEESAGAALGGQLIAVAGSKGGVGTTTVALQLALAAVRAAPGRPVCVVDFDLQKGDFRSFLDMPHRRSVVDLVEVADEISVRHLQETLYTHKEGFRVLLAPDDGERAEEVNALVARSILSAVKARHALTIVDLGATVSEASAIGAEIANRTLVVTQPDVVSLRGVKRLLELWKRLQVREDDEDVLVVLNRTSRKLEVQPDLARKVIAGRLARTTIPADFSSFEAAVNTGTPARMEDAKLRGSFDALLDEADALPAAATSPRPTRPSRAA